MIMSSQGVQFDFFLSYSHEDRQIASQIARDLAERGRNIFFDEWTIRVGDSLIERINYGLQNSTYLLVLISKNSLSSKWVNLEIGSAFRKDSNSANARIIPVLIENIAPTLIPSFLRNIKWVDLSKGYENGIRQITALAQLPRNAAKTPSQLFNVKDLAKEVAIEVTKMLNSNSKGVRLPSSNVLGDPTNLVFVIMPFSPEMDPIFEGIRAAAKENNLVAERVKDVQGDYKITEKIMEMIHAARMIVADLTHERPNVYFELGYARGMGKTVITIARKKTKLHFDIKDWTCEFYTDSRIVENCLTKRFNFELHKE